MQVGLLLLQCQPCGLSRIDDESTGCRDILFGSFSRHLSLLTGPDVADFVQSYNLYEPLDLRKEMAQALDVSELDLGHLYINICNTLLASRCASLTVGYFQIHVLDVWGRKGRYHNSPSHKHFVT